MKKWLKFVYIYGSYRKIKPGHCSLLDLNLFVGLQVEEVSNFML